MPRLLRNHYVLAVPDAQTTAEFFIEALGFTTVPVGDEGWRFVRRDGCMVMLGSCPGAIHPRELGDHSYFGYLVVDDADAYHREVRPKAPDRVSAIEDKPWGMREFSVRTPDGHRIMVGAELRDGDPGAGS